MFRNKEKTHNIIFNLSIILGLFLPHDRFLFLIVNPILIILLFKTSLKHLKFGRLNQIKFLFVIIVILSTFINLTFGNQFENKEVGRLLLFLLLFILFPFVYDAKISSRLLYFSLFFIFVSQLTFVYNIGILVNFFDTFWPYTGNQLAYSTEFLTQRAGDIDWIVNRRYGGLYKNPNQAVRYVSLLLTVFFIENRNKPYKTVLPFITISFLSYVFSGSRSGLLIGSILVFMYLLYLRGTKFYLKDKVIGGVIFVLIALIILWFSQLQNWRFFNIKSGFEDSMATKVMWFLGFFNQLESPIIILIGHSTVNNVQNLYGVRMLDSEWGELFFSFGLIGFLLIIGFYSQIFKRKDKYLRFYLIMLLWAVSSTILFSFRMSFLFMLFLSKYYSESFFRDSNKLNPPK